MSIFTPDLEAPEVKLIPGAPIEDPAAILTVNASNDALAAGEAFSKEVAERFVSDFEKSEELYNAGKTDEKDLMCHVSTFVFNKGVIYMTYYASTKDAKEDPNNQTARFVFCPADHPENKIFLDVMTVGETFRDPETDQLYEVKQVYDTILMPWDDDTLYILWTANISGKYYRLYRVYHIASGVMDSVRPNRFRVGDVTNDFSTSGIKAALAANGLGVKQMYSDIGIMQKLSTRVEDGVTCYYTGCYSGDFNAIIKSRDLITWEFVAQPEFINWSKWENATYVIGDKVYYFVRQQAETEYGFLTAYDLNEKKWDRPVLIGDSQSRSDFIVYNGGLYLFHAPIDREHLGIVKVDTDRLAASRVILQAKMNTSCFYPFIQYGEGSDLYLSYTVARKHIRLSCFDPAKYLK